MRRKKFYISQRLRDPVSGSSVSLVIGRFRSREDRNRAFTDNRLWKKDCFCGINGDEGNGKGARCLEASNGSQEQGNKD